MPLNIGRRLGRGAIGALPLLGGNRPDKKTLLLFGAGIGAAYLAPQWGLGGTGSLFFLGVGLLAAIAHHRRDRRMVMTWPIVALAAWAAADFEYTADLTDQATALGAQGSVLGSNGLVEGISKAGPAAAGWIVHVGGPAAVETVKQIIGSVAS